ncbi:hypothetical protein GCM10010488_06900 [Oerskovia jenensis]|uniref:Acetyltransferase (GNAT) family protein n=1 Tax=Oerskovia jenensis TaxID=162169 RepID=A0ABS2LC91_9CELL|nr:hypothetical protein [Oerskovia jenensis]
MAGAGYKIGQARALAEVAGPAIALPFYSKQGFEPTGWRRRMTE